MPGHPKRVLWITTDHMRYDCIRAHGNPEIHTPNIDRLVNDGVSFSNCFAQNPLCMPSRCSFMTGLYPQQTGVDQNGHSLPADFEPTVASCFNAGGYQTVQIGKLHFEPHEDRDLDPKPKNHYGFDIMYLSEESGCYEDAYMTWLRTEHPEYVNVFRLPRSTSPKRQGEVEGVVLDAPWEYSHAGWISEMACRFLEPRSLTHFRRPNLFMHLGFYSPHPPLNPTREMFEPYRHSTITLPEPVSNEANDKPEPLRSMLGMCRDWTRDRLEKYRRHFYAMVTGVDMAIGKILKNLETNNLLDDTLIVFGSDHGDMCGDHGMILKQISYYDELMKMPLIFHQPTRLATPGRRIEPIMEMVDILPTLLGLCDCAVPEVMAGLDVSKELLSGVPVSGRDSAFAYHGPGNAMVRTQTHKYIRYGQGKEVLYNLTEAPFEVRNRVNDDPTTLAAMRELMLQRMLDASRSARPLKYRF
ncbi:MAG: sulfatase-like hydrolase/transferase [Planctomycetota bacterium]